ncbi:MAG TPA: hypothetical protein VMW87_01305 [Spirochaetia bacterium]|nr:hypothetical protein [Spirochaetia bacterium]
MTTVTVDAGICGFKTVIRVTSGDSQHATVELRTSCPNIKPMESVPLEVDAYVECFAGIGESSIYETARTFCKHPGCPLPSGIIKGIEVACGLALPKDALIRVSKEDNVES